MNVVPGLLLLAGSLVPAAWAAPADPAAQAAPRPALPLRPAPPPWSAESPRSAGARFGLGLDVRLDRLEGLEAVGGSIEVGGPGGTVVPLDPDLDNRKFERELVIDGLGVQAPVALPRFALRGMAVDPSLVLEVAAVEARLDFRPRTPDEPGESLDGRGTMWGVGVEWTATLCRRCRLFWGGGYRFRSLSGLDLDRAARLGGGVQARADEVRLDSDTHLLGGRLGLLSRHGRFAPYLGVRGRWTELEVEDELRFVGPAGETALRSRLELEEDGVAGLVGVDARVGERLHGRLEAAVDDDGSAVLVKLVHHFGGGREPAGGRDETGEELARLAPGLAADLERIRRELAERRRALRDVSGPGAVSAYLLADVLALLDRIEAELEAALDAPALGPLRDLFTVAIAEARDELTAAARTGAAAPVQPPGIALAAWRLAQDPPAGTGRRVLADRVDEVFDALDRFIDRVGKLASNDDLQVELCFCSSPPRLYYSIVRFFDRTEVTGGRMSESVELPFGIYRIEVGLTYEERRAASTRLDLRNMGSKVHCEVDLSQPGGTPGAAVGQPFCDHRVDDDCSCGPQP